MKAVLFVESAYWFTDERWLRNWSLGHPGPLDHMCPVPPDVDLELTIYYLTSHVCDRLNARP